MLAGDENFPVTPTKKFFQSHQEIPIIQQKMIGFMSEEKDDFRKQLENFTSCNLEGITKKKKIANNAL